MMMTDDFDGLEFGFSASGWLMLYQLGVAHALQRHGIHRARNARFIGSSGGSAVSAALALNVDTELLRDFMLRCCSDYHKNPIRNMFKMREYAKHCIERCMEETTHSDLKGGRLNVAITILPQVKKAVVSDFANNEEYLEAVLASCTMSPLAGFPFQLNRPNDPELHGSWVFDGGMTALVPTLSPNTVRCSPFYCFDAEIQPSRYVPIYWAAFPPSVTEMKELFWLGAHDGEVWMHKNGYGSLKICKTVLQASQGKNVQKIKPVYRTENVSPLSTANSNVSIVNRESFNRVRTNSGSTTESSMYRQVIQHDALLAGHELTGMQQKINRMGDSVAYATVAHCAKPIALGIVYVELWVKALASGVGAAVSAVENKRRDAVTSSKGLLSLRRWVHTDMLGNAADSWRNTKECVATALNPTILMHQLPGSSYIVGEDTASNAHTQLQNNSTVYRYLRGSSMI